MKWALLSVSCLLCIGSVNGQEGKKANWNVIERDGRNYVSARNMASFYQFTDVWESEETPGLSMSLESPRMEVSVLAGDEFIRVNKVKFGLFHPVVRDEESGAILISTKDLARVIEPVLRPSRSTPREAPDRVSISPIGEAALLEHFDIDVLQRLLKMAGWEAVAPDAERSLELELHFVEGEPAQDGVEITTEWVGTEAREKWERSNQAIAFATAIHAQVLRGMNAKDGGVNPRGVQEATGSTPVIAMHLTVPPDFVAYRHLSRLVAKALEREALVNQGREVPVASVEE